MANVCSENCLQAAVVELRELEQKFPDFEMCHVCLGNALVGGKNLEAAEAEYRLALKLAPADPDALWGLGKVKREQKDYDAALEIYKAAEKIAPDSTGLFQATGELLLEKKDYSGALEEFKKAVQLEPSSWEVHEAYGRAPRSKRGTGTGDRGAEAGCGP
jgi:tetratricopeptide (TPR) repeat protein